MFNRESESLSTTLGINFGASLWGAEATMMVAFGPPENALELENLPATLATRLILLLFGGLNLCDISVQAHFAALKF